MTLRSTSKLYRSSEGFRTAGDSSMRFKIDDDGGGGNDAADADDALDVFMW
eukprot:CAMPEP_0172538516 /NCGR_PEP_ID=MMETSP1067-20121228/9889_1 /TAXON_ID=265564 ORGANISM="Thalassiosira punctigera, Strain Tpunct2005C2" /NCGR_SAMPLE_ID=MMETSP1067 /ASSEMBLY_ACC=CAM_ASM_000444 /LENGTH=50 /DNA_ID=CAMNT_0013324023 /DNA_START=523 /DNA_END=672 /DNA_ORIENTATION=+